MVGVVEDVDIMYIWCTVLFFISWMKELFLPFKSYAVNKQLLY